MWTFHLREGVTFSNGTPFNADSVLANFDRMKKGPFESSFYGMNIDTIYPGLVSYEKTDDYTVVLTLSEGQPLLDYTMVNYGSAIFEPSCFAEDGTFAGFPIGTGPYVVTENVLGQYCVIERNDNYWGTPGIAKTFRFKVIPDAETRYTALRAGEVQGLCDLGAISPPRPRRSTAIRPTTCPWATPASPTSSTSTAAPSPSTTCACGRACPCCWTARPSSTASTTATASPPAAS